MATIMKRSITIGEGKRRRKEVQTGRLFQGGPGKRWYILTDGPGVRIYDYGNGTKTVSIIQCGGWRATKSNQLMVIS